MADYPGPVEAIDALLDALIDDKLGTDDEIKATVRRFVKERSPVDGVVQALEFAYACADDAPDALKEWAADAAVMAAGHGFHGLGDDMRGLRIAKVLRGQQIAQKDKPAPLERFAPPPPAPAAGDGSNA